MELVEWIVKVHQRPCHLVCTKRRLLPLEVHIVAPEKRMFRVKHDEEIDEEQIGLAFDGSGVKCLFQRVSESSERPNFAAKFRSGIEESCDWIGHLLHNEMGPLVVFCESRKMCYQIAEALASRSLVSAETSPEIEKLLTAGLRQKEFAVRGIGIYHSGVIPPFLDLIRTLFERKRIQVIITTSEFVIPAKTVFIHSLPRTKQQFLQMTECAGRRDVDVVGTILIPISALTSQENLVDFLKATPEPYLGSSYFSFRSLLTEWPVDTSFRHFLEVRSLSAKRETLRELKSEFKWIDFPNESITKLWIDLSDRIEQTRTAIAKLPRLFSAATYPGAIVRSTNGLGWGIIASVVDSRELIVIHRAKLLSDARKLLPVDHPLPYEVSAYFVQVFQSDLTAISTAVLDISGHDFSAASIRDLSEKLDVLISAGTELMDERLFIPPQCLDRYDSLQTRLETLNKMFHQLPRPSAQAIARCCLRQDKMKECKKLEQQVLQATTEHDQDTAAERELLIQLRYLDSEGALLPKGRAAQLVHAGQELLLVELVCRGILRVLTPQHIAALFSGLCADDPETEVELPFELIEPWSQLEQLHGLIGMEVNPISPRYIPIVWRWIEGASIEELWAELDECCEGLIMRSLRMTHKLLRQAARVANQIGDLDVELLLLQANVLVKRGMALDDGKYVDG
jgi:ATP-dependent RNA helicase DOB1